MKQCKIKIKARTQQRIYIKKSFAECKKEFEKYAQKKWNAGTQREKDRWVKHWDEIEEELAWMHRVRSTPFSYHRYIPKRKREPLYPLNRPSRRK